MPIIFDSSESQHLEPDLRLETFVPWLESETGADFVLSTWDAPTTTDTLIRKHVERGMGIQLKRGLDLVSSVKDRRLVNQLAKMRETWSDPVVLHHCTMGLRGEKALFNGNESVGKKKFSYRAYQTTIRSIFNLGALYVNVDADYSLSQWIQDELERMREFKDERLVCKPRIRLIQLSPQEETLATFPGVGPVKAHELWEEMPKHGAQQTLLQALAWMTDGYAREYVAGFGNVTDEQCREHLGVRDGERLCVEITGGYARVNEVVEIKNANS